VLFFNHKQNFSFQDGRGDIEHSFNKFMEGKRKICNGENGVHDITCPARKEVLVSESSEFNVDRKENGDTFRSTEKQLIAKAEKKFWELGSKAGNKNLRKLPRDLFRGIGDEASPYYCSEEKMEKIHTYLKLAKDLFEIEPNGFLNTTISNVKGLTDIFCFNHQNVVPIECFSVASNAITVEKNLKDKEQYLKFDRIKDKLLEIFDKYKIEHKYSVFLADIDYKYSLNEYSK